jgi:hypothetical protein
MTFRRGALIVVNLLLGTALAALRVWPSGDLITVTQAPDNDAWIELLRYSNRSSRAALPSIPAERKAIVEHADIRVVGILINGDRKTAVVLAKGESETQRVLEGDRIHGGRIVRIKPRSIEMDQAGSRLEFPLDPPRNTP